MTAHPHTDQVLDEYDRPVPGAEIYVTDTLTLGNANLTIDGTVPLAQPIIADEFGFYTYWANDGIYREDVYFAGKLRYKGLAYVGVPPQIKGDPGGNILSVGLFAAFSTFTIPAGADIVRTSGYNTLGNAAAYYQRDAAVDPAYVAAHPYTSAISFNGLGYRLVQPDEVFDLELYGVSAANTETTNTGIVDAVLEVALPGNVTLIFPQGVIPCRVRVPSLTNAYISTVTVRGKASPATWFGTVAGYSMSTKGTILQSSAPATDGVTGGVIEALTAGGFSSVKLVVRRIGVRTYDNPNQHGINAFHAQQFIAEDVSVDTGVWSPSASLPTNVRYGIRVPGNGNGAFTSVRNVSISGFYVGMDVWEHVDGDNISIAACKYGLEFLGTNHPSRFGRVGIWRCQTPILADSGSHRTSIQELAIEHVNATDEPTSWQITTYDIDDPGNDIAGDCLASTVTGNVGYEWTLAKNGASNFSVMRMDGIWLDYTPTVSAASGAFGSVSASGAFYQRGKTVNFRAKITITDVGTAAGNWSFTIPVATSASVTTFQVCVGKVDDGPSIGISGTGTILNNSLTCATGKYDGTFIGTTGDTIIFQGSYESA